ncbi:hypothetical protein IHE45_12G041800 [Dioscorea alata]|uniref:Uncharacterized protein n=1 Tax=Dioscorea alata TaxID=55571 RepID=A0ACB7V216_DIOAL|nr:hypothetical protein IHE45_12G041800 [Dioscorea alata]
MPQGKSNTATTAGKDEWAILMDDSENYVKELRSNTKPLIQRVPKVLYKQETNNRKLFIPEVIALGPYHHNNPDLKDMQHHKYLAAKQLIGTKPIHVFKAGIEDVISKVRRCYKEDLEMEDDELVTMMFFDGCFLLRFIDLFVRCKLDELQMRAHLYGFIQKDIFLLENQMPYVVLQVLMNVTTKVDIDLFMRKMIGTSPNNTWATEAEPIHLLDLFRTTLLGEAAVTPPILPNADKQLFRSVTELKEIGIEFKKSEKSCVRDVTFNAGHIHSCLSLPLITIDDLFQSRFMNMIAMEICPDSKLEHAIQSYIWFMDCLIDRADDVKELRSAKILENYLGSDEQVANLFNEISTDLHPDLRIYGNVLSGLQRHRNNNVRVSFVRFYNTHFSSPWTAISFFAAAFVLLLTVVQTVFAVFPRQS